MKNLKLLGLKSTNPSPSIPLTSPPSSPSRWRKQRLRQLAREQPRPKPRLTSRQSVCREGKRSQGSAKEANLQLRRFGADGVAKACSRFGVRHGSTIGKEEGQSRHRAEQHRVASAQGRSESWREYEANYPEEPDYYEIARSTSSLG